MTKLFVIAGEASGDELAAWFLKKKDRELVPHFDCVEGVGGKAFVAAGGKLYASLEELNVVGGVELLAHVVRLNRFLKKLARYIVENSFTHVLLVDFPGFNLRLAHVLKKCAPSIKIVYLSPPQTWCWGAWRIKKLKRLCDELIVLFPFEVAWYASHGLSVHYWGNPVWERMQAASVPGVQQKFRVGIFPGSRAQELEKFIPFLKKIIAALLVQFPSLEVAVFQAPTAHAGFLQQLVDVDDRRVFMILPADRIRVMQTCCVALAKAGTVTLELGLASMPTVVFYKTSFLTYAVARLLVKVKWMSLPNILVQKVLMQEFIQERCTEKLVVEAVVGLLKMWNEDSEAYQCEQEKVGELQSILS